MDEENNQSYFQNQKDDEKNSEKVKSMEKLEFNK